MSAGEKDPSSGHFYKEQVRQWFAHHSPTSELATTHTKM